MPGVQWHFELVARDGFCGAVPLLDTHFRLPGTGQSAAGGFLGIGTKPVALTTNQLVFMRDEDGDVHATTSWTKEQVLALPEHRH